MEESTQRRHPEHDRLHAEVRSWFTTTFPALGYVVEHRRFGFYRRRTKSPDQRLIVVESLTPSEVPEFLADAREYYGNSSVEIWIEGRDQDATLGPALVAAGCIKELANVTLAFVGARPESAPRADVIVEPVTAETVTDYVIVKLKGFANSEDEPRAEQIEDELAIRRSELAGIGRFLVARVGGELASIVGYYDGSDRLIFNLATRIPFRNRGIAKYLLCRVIADSFDRQCRSVTINTNPDDTPIRMYRRLGFSDEIYWRRGYLLK